MNSILRSRNLKQFPHNFLIYPDEIIQMKKYQEQRNKISKRYIKTIYCGKTSELIHDISLLLTKYTLNKSK